MLYMMVYKVDENSIAGGPPDPKIMAAMGVFTEELVKAGVLIGTGGLQPSIEGARLRLSSGKMTVTDGPFTEAKELIGGYAIVDVKSKEEALELGKRFLKLHGDILGASYVGEAEIRPMFGMTDFTSPDSPRQFDHAVQASR
jgi:hypothetical protein